MPGEDSTPVSPTPTPDPVARAAAAKRAAREAAARESAEELLAEGADVVSQVARSKNPLTSFLGVGLVTLLTGGAVGFGGWNASTAITSEVQALRKELADSRKETAELAKKFEDVARELRDLVATAKAEKHEARIAELEKQDRVREKLLDRLLLEIETLKKGAGK